jgi:hypothetical protein
MGSWKREQLEEEWGFFGRSWKSIWKDDEGHQVTGRGSTPEEAEKDALKRIEKHEYDSGCLVTTACVRWAGLPDDCRELTLMRHLREEHVRRRPDGARILEIYAALAPRLIDRIEASPDADAVWARTLAAVRRAADLVEAGRLPEAFAMAWAEFRRLCRERLGVDPDS